MNSADKRKQVRLRERMGNLARGFDDAEKRMEIAEGKVNGLETELTNEKRNHAWAITRANNAVAAVEKLQTIVGDYAKQKIEISVKHAAEIANMLEARDVTIDTLNREIMSLKSEDRDPAKLRRRLQVRADKLDHLQKLISTLRASAEKSWDKRT